MLQWIVATMCNKKVDYYSFGDKRITNKENGITLEEIVEKMREKNVTIGQLWDVLKAKSASKKKFNVFLAINNKLKLGIKVPQQKKLANKVKISQL